MASKIIYQIVGRYMNGNEVTGYHLLSAETGKTGRYTKEQVCYLVGRGQITNCTGQIYKDKVLLRGVGVSLEDLPVQQENGDLYRTDNVGKIRKGTSAEDAMTQVILIGAITSGRNTVAYVVQNAGGGRRRIERDEIFNLAKAGRIGNARYQESNGKPILRGVGINLNQLPQISESEIAGTPNNVIENARIQMNNRTNSLANTFSNKLVQYLNQALSKPDFDNLFNVVDNRLDDGRIIKIVSNNMNVSVFEVKEEANQGRLVYNGTQSVIDLNNEGFKLVVRTMLTSCKVSKDTRVTA